MSLFFDGANHTNGTFSGTTLPTGTAVRTTALWFRCSTSSPTTFVLVNWGANVNGQRWDLFYDGSSHLGLECTNFANLFSWTPDTNWHHLALVLPAGATTSDGCLGYLDGVLKTKATGINGTLNTTNDSPTYGQLNAASGFAFAGDLCESACWSADLTAAEIAALARGAYPGRTRPGALVYYHQALGAFPNNLLDFSGHSVTTVLNFTTQSAGHAPVAMFTTGGRVNVGSTVTPPPLPRTLVLATNPTGPVLNPYFLEAA